ncbi:3-oxoadipate enol-lactonase [Povalibacter uvarum]|uniref:3-oxoadipate enol-lactonase n=1 Tax=Povalibacter uvarum TaxID=732238 RepID=A0A841HWC8_9GAMM|nr:alpha/beta fold hydrolase [Povalibacter uvarum]MBB6096510.1 3-oxoadipate enol-lactonase [Povalibacter uvarum]
MSDPITSWHDIGPRSAPVVVLLHAIATDSDLWASQIPVWSQRFRLLAVDLPGHGASKPRPHINSVEAYADALAQLLLRESIQTASIVGLSLGGMIAQAFALSFPERVRSLVLSNTSARTPPAMQDIWSKRMQQAVQHGMEHQVAPTIERWFTPRFTERAPLHVARIARMIRSTSLEGYVAAIEAIQRLDLLDRLPELSMPALVITGRLDPAATPQIAETIAGKLPDSRLTVIEDAAHLSNIEQPGAFVESVGAFLEQTR